MLWNSFLYNPIVNLLVIFYHYLGSNVGLAIIALTLFIRFLLAPISTSHLKTLKKQKELAPKLDKLKKKYSGDKKRLAEEQMRLYKDNNINPAAGCLPQIAQLILLIALYRVLITVLGNSGGISSLNNILYFDFLKFPEGAAINNRFLYLDLSKPDPYLILPILAGASQFFVSKLTLPQTKKAEKVAKKTDDKKDDVMYNMQEQMLYIFPIMTIFIGWKLPAGLVLYWFMSTAASAAQQYVVNSKK